MASIRSRADELVKEDHPKPEQVMKCSDLVYTRWQQLMKKAKEKQQVVMASYNFFKTSEQVWRFSTKFFPHYQRFYTRLYAGPPFGQQNIRHDSKFHQTL